jgi:hypothetical protein
VINWNKGAERQGIVQVSNLDKWKDSFSVHGEKEQWKRAKPESANSGFGFEGTSRQQGGDFGYTVGNTALECLGEKNKGAIDICVVFI